MAKNKQTSEMIRRLAHTAFPNDQIAAVDELTEGLCNAAYMIELSSGIKTVLKISSAGNFGLLRNETDLPETEVAALKLVNEKGLVKVPKVYYYDFSQTVCTGKFFFMEALEGNSFTSVGYMLSDNERESIYRRIGKIVKELSRIKAKRFGSLVSTEKQYDTLFELVFQMLSNVLDDAADKNIDLGVSGIEILDRLRSDKRIFDEVTESTLIHEDMWEGNVFIKDGTVAGIIDWERSMWGDPLMEEYFRNHHHVDSFYEGYGRSELTENEVKRTYWYDLFLFLTMLTEPEYREYEDKNCNDWVLPSLKTACEKLMINYRR